MAYKKRTSGNKTYSRSRSSRTSRGRTSGRAKSGGSRRGPVQTVRLVIEQPQAPALNATGQLQVEKNTKRKARF